MAVQSAAATARFLEVVAELERRRSWESWEARSMAHWVSWQCGLGLRAAREHVRVAVALRELPEARAALAQLHQNFLDCGIRHRDDASEMRKHQSDFNSQRPRF